MSNGRHDTAELTNTRLPSPYLSQAKLASSGTLCTSPISTTNNEGSKESHQWGFNPSLLGQGRRHL